MKGELIEMAKHRRDGFSRELQREEAAMLHLLRKRLSA